MTVYLLPLDVNLEVDVGAVRERMEGSRAVAAEFRSGWAAGGVLEGGGRGRGTPSPPGSCFWESTIPPISGVPGFRRNVMCLGNSGSVYAQRVYLRPCVRYRPKYMTFSLKSGGAEM